MTAVDLPAAAAASADVAAALRSRGVSDVDDSALTRTLYAADASLYRVVPQVVARPRHVDEIDAVLDAARATGVPVTMRGAGTSIAGNAVGPGIVVDTARHLDRILALDPEAQTATVEPGVVHARLQARAHQHGLRFGPDPSTHTRCTIGGMIGNNACGSRALGYGRTSDNVVGLDLLTGSGERVRTHDGRTLDRPGGSDVEQRLAAIVDAELGHVRQTFGRFSRQVSGYALEQLLPEQGRRLDRLITGSEGTLALVREATVSLVRDHPERLLLVLGYASMAEAADAVPTLLALGAQRGAGTPGDRARLVACEGLDSRIVGLVRARSGGVPDLPRGAGWLFAEVAGEGAADLVERLRADAGALESRLITDPGQTAALWRIRDDGAGLAARSLSRPAHAGWEDAAVPPEHLGAWLRDFDDLLREHGLDGVPYGHFGDGCVHVRIDFRFDDGGRSFREFLEASATALVKYGGSLSGEHGDGRARSALLPLMYDPHTIDLFGAVKHACDPDGLLNPGVLVDARPVEADVRPARPRTRVNPGLRLLHDGGDLATAAHRCTGVGKCVAASSTGVMCPSWQATRDEKDSTRGRARVLQEALDAGPGGTLTGLRDPALHEALDLCLSCKGCASDCPTGVDMASYKSEVLHQTYRGRTRPLSHYTLGRLPTWLGLIGRAPALAPALNAAGRFAPTARLATAAAGVDHRRSLPAVASRSLRRSARPGRTGTPDVWIWSDSFTDQLSPHTGEATLALLRAAGVRAEVIPEPACCGLTWVTTGQLDQARRIVGRTVATLSAYVGSGVPVVGLEPSCLATLRSDAEELVDSPDATAVAHGVRTLAELLTDLADQGRWTPPDLSGVEVLVQPHCHQASILGFDADTSLLERCGADVTVVAGCCGLAGNFGMEKGHYETSVAVAETHLLPAVRARGEKVVLADGVSCRVQLDDLEQLRALHLAELLAFGAPADQSIARARPRPGRTARRGRR